MAALSPVMSNSSSGANPPPALTATAVNSVNRSDTPQRTLRGLNKPKCKQCGNVARSRCPYESCKNCCAKAQNPCHIHVLKSNATFSDKAVPSSPLFDQQSTDVSSSVNSHRVASFRQLSSTFSQFSGLQVPLRKKPLTRKDAAAINEWRFSKLNEFKGRNIEIENEAFDRYIQNVSLLEEVFSPNTHTDGSTEDDLSTIPGLKSKLRFNPTRTNTFRKRLKQIVDQGLETLKKYELDDSGNLANDLDKSDKAVKNENDFRADRVSTLSDLIDKLNKARNDEDLKSCLELKSQLFGDQAESGLESGITELSTEQIAENNEFKTEVKYSVKKSVKPTEIDHEALLKLDAHFSSMERVENL